MNYLLDTHTLIWAMLDKEKLSDKAKSALEDPLNKIFVSAISFWEISLKFSIGKLNLNGITPEEIPGIVAKMQFDMMPLEIAEASTYHQLTTLYHRDPFDRMLIWQAIHNNFVFVTGDNKMSAYQSQGLQLLW